MLTNDILLESTIFLYMLINWLPDATFLVVIHNPREEYMLIHDID